MKTRQTVRRLFNDKASSWSQKYAVDGGLVPRLETIVSQVRRLIEPRSRLLDFGCGPGTMAAYLLNQGYQVAACDIADKMIDEGRRLYPSAEIEWVKLQPDWQQLPFPANSFAAIVAASVFEYIDEPARILEECRRVLQPGGKLLFTVPNVKTRLRRIERLLRPAAVRLRNWPIAGLNLRLQNYLIYLTISANRLPVDQWGILAKEAGFSTCESNQNRHIECGKYMLLLCYEK